MVIAKGKLLAVAIRLTERAPMQEMFAAGLTREAGVSSDFRGKPGPRQVTVLTRDGWEAACSEIGTQLPWTTRRANLFIEGMDLKGTLGYELSVGEAVLRISGETGPCSRMEEGCPGLMSALKPHWRGGVTAYVTRVGCVTVGCDVVLSRDLASQVSVVIYDRLRRAAKRGKALAGRVARVTGLSGGYASERLW
jgi:MOSC domain-containing protein YiiM